MKKMTLDDIAELAHVSRSVVSRVLNNHPRVGDETRRRVEKVIKEHNYRPSSRARGLSTDRTYEICVLAPRRESDSLASGFWPLLHAGIFEQCMERGYFISLNLMSPELESAFQDRILREDRFDGYLLIAQEVRDLTIPVLHERDIPCALIGYKNSDGNYPSVDVDIYKGAYKATKHLCDMGHKRVSAILGNLQWKESIERKRGFTKALREADVPVTDTAIEEAEYSQASGYEVMQRWIKQGNVPSAVFCGSDSIAMGVLLALHRAKISVPQEVAVVGFDDVPASAYTIPPLTTVNQQIHEKGKHAANLLIDIIEGAPSEAKHFSLEPKLIVRESCGAS